MMKVNFSHKFVSSTRIADYPTDYALANVIYDEMNTGQPYTITEIIKTFKCVPKAVTAQKITCLLSILQSKKVVTHSYNSGKSIFVKV